MITDSELLMALSKAGLVGITVSDLVVARMAWRLAVQRVARDTGAPPSREALRLAQHYTSPPIVEQVNAAAQRLGVKRGEVTVAAWLRDLEALGRALYPAPELRAGRVRRGRCLPLLRGARARTAFRARRGKRILHRGQATRFADHEASPRRACADARTGRIQALLRLRTRALAVRWEPGWVRVEAEQGGDAVSSTHRGAERQPDDLYVTPAFAARAILPHLGAPMRVLDPAVGTGSLLQAARAFWHPRTELYGLDIEDRGWAGTVVRDALSPDPWPRVDLILANPPYCLAMPFLERALREVAPGGYRRLSPAPGLDGWAGTRQIPRCPSLGRVRAATAAEFHWAPEVAHCEVPDTHSGKEAGRSIEALRARAWARRRMPCDWSRLGGTMGGSRGGPGVGDDGGSWRCDQCLTFTKVCLSSLRMPAKESICANGW